MNRPSIIEQAKAVAVMERHARMVIQHNPSREASDTADALSAAAATLAAVPTIVEALNGTLTLIREVQVALTGYLVPGGYGADKAVAKLLGLLDGPHQREIEGAARAALRALAREDRG